MDIFLCHSSLKREHMAHYKPAANHKHAQSSRPSLTQPNTHMGPQLDYTELYALSKRWVLTLHLNLETESEERM